MKRIRGGCGEAENSDAREIIPIGARRTDDVVNLKSNPPPPEKVTVLPAAEVSVPMAASPGLSVSPELIVRSAVMVPVPASVPSAAMVTGGSDRGRRPYVEPKPAILCRRW